MVQKRWSGVLPAVLLLAGHVLASGASHAPVMEDERLDLASALSSVYHSDTSALQRAAGIAALAPRAYGIEMGLEDVPTALPVPDSRELALELAIPSADAARFEQAISRLEGDAQAHLLSLLARFAAFETAASAALVAASAGPPFPAGLYVARNALVVEIATFVDAVRADPPMPFVLDLAPVLVLDTAGVGSVYEADVQIILDLGGDDLYLNNAGGNGRDCTGLSLVGFAAALVVDLGGNDSYASGRSCGVNGGGYYGAGFLFDAEGSDTYTAGQRGVNGGGIRGAGLLVDLSGHDIYTAAGGGTNGGASSGAGTLIDLAGNDLYLAGGGGANGGGQVGFGFLFDGDGDDVYEAGQTGTNGGAHADLLAARGVLIDLHGDDAYSAACCGTNGGSWTGVGFLFDGDGNDKYMAAETGVNGEAWPVLGCFIICYVNHSGGLLFDAGGTDVYFDNWMGGTFTDRTIVPKGYVGAQVDTDCQLPCQHG